MLVVARSVEALRQYCTRMARAQLDFADAVVAKKVEIACFLFSNGLPTDGDGC